MLEARNIIAKITLFLCFIELTVYPWFYVLIYRFHGAREVKAERKWLKVQTKKLLANVPF